LHNDGRRTTGGGLQLTYQPSGRAMYHIRGLINHDNRNTHSQGNQWNSNMNWFEWPIITQGSFIHQIGFQDVEVQNYVFNSGASYVFNTFEMNLGLGWSHSNVHWESAQFPFQTNGMNYSIDEKARSRPVVNLTDMPLPSSGSMVLQTIDHVTAVQVENTFSGNLDFELPFRMGSFKLGSSLKLKTKDAADLGSYTTFEMNYRGIMRLTGFEKDNDGMDVLDQYHIPWMVDLDNLRDFFLINSAGMSKNREKMRKTSDYRNYKISENIYAGYSMVSFQAGRLSLSGGMRMEYTYLNNSGRLTEFDRFGRYEQTTSINRSHNHLDFFPNVRLGYDPGEQTRLQLGYYRSINRPSFQMLAPFELVNRQDTTLYRGNPSLEPVFAHHVDFQADHHLPGLGILSAGLFYMELDNFAVLEQQTIHVREGDFPGFDPMFDEQTTEIPVRGQTYQNSRQSATVYGMELSWQQNLAFLPGFLGNLGIYANYTWSHSVYKTDRSKDSTLPFQSPQVVNAALNYTHGRFFSQISYHWTASYLSSLGSNGAAPSVHGQDSVYLDRYQDGWSDLTASFRFRISNQFRFWADASNLLGTERVLYQYSRQFYPTQIDYNGGRNFRIGIRYDL
jgi:TonB-dependent receptor